MNDIKSIIEDCHKSDLVSTKVIRKIIEIIGQERWQELDDEENDVCTTMGELIIALEGNKWHENVSGVILYHGNGECKVIAWREIPRFEEE